MWKDGLLPCRSPTAARAISSRRARKQLPKTGDALRRSLSTVLRRSRSSGENIAPLPRQGPNRSISIGRRRSPGPNCNRVQRRNLNTGPRRKQGLNRSLDQHRNIGRPRSLDRNPGRRRSLGRNLGPRLSPIKSRVLVRNTREGRTGKV